MSWGSTWRSAKCSADTAYLTSWSFTSLSYSSASHMPEKSALGSSHSLRASGQWRESHMQAVAEVWWCG